MDKIKVSKSVADALDKALKVMDKEKFFEEHSNKLQWTLGIYLPLNEISNWDMAQILINGYEVEETEEEKLEKKYRDKLEYFNKKGKDNYESGKIYGFVEGVNYTLQILKIKIKGIND